jgi:hypothetical protein
MAKKIVETPRKSPSRLKMVAFGAVLGAVWGAVMWGIFALLGQDSGGRGLAYLLISTAMIGGGVSAIFGANQVRKQGERVTPKMKMPSRKK